MPASRAAGVKCRDSVSPALTLQKTKTVCPGQKLTPDCGELFRAPQASVWEIPLLRVKRLCRETVPESASDPKDQFARALALPHPIAAAAGRSSLAFRFTAFRFAGQAPLPRAAGWRVGLRADRSIWPADHADTPVNGVPAIGLRASSWTVNHGLNPSTTAIAQQGTYLPCRDGP
jgi:hypothetical protein